METMMDTTTMEPRYFPAEMSVPIAAEYLRANGMRSNAVYCYGLVSAGVIPSEKRSQRLVVAKEDLDRFLSERASTTE